MASEPKSIGDFFSRNPQGYSFSGSGLAVNISNIFSNLIGIISLVAGVVFLIYFMLGAINWITAGGEAQKAQKARAMITSALIGLTVSVLAYPMAFVLAQLVGIPFAEPAEFINNLIF